MTPMKPILTTFEGIIGEYESICETALARESGP
jgi:hypothetical protein